MGRSGGVVFEAKRTDPGGAWGMSVRPKNRPRGIRTCQDVVRSASPSIVWVLRLLRRRGAAKAIGTRDRDERRHKRKGVRWSKYAPTATALVVTAAIAGEYCVPAFRPEGGVRNRMQTRSASVLNAQVDDRLLTTAGLCAAAAVRHHYVFERWRREGFSS